VTELSDRDRELRAKLPKNWMEILAAGIRPVGEFSFLPNGSVVHLLPEELTQICQRRQEITELRVQRRKQKLPAPEVLVWRNLTYRGVPMQGALKRNEDGKLYAVWRKHERSWASQSKRDVALDWFRHRWRTVWQKRYWKLEYKPRPYPQWHLLFRGEVIENYSVNPPSRSAILATAWREWRNSPSPTIPNYFGFRKWRWDEGLQRLTSPYQRTVWETAELHAHQFAPGSLVSGVAGIHARLVPRNWWRLRTPEEQEVFGVVVWGIVERFGAYVLGEQGWRAEHAVIRVLLAQSLRMQYDLERAYPGVPIVQAGPRLDLRELVGGW
jgi:hypothetical protein